MKIRERFNQLSPNRKKVVIWSLMAALLLVLVATGYNSRSGLKGGKQMEQGEDSRLEADLMEKTIAREYRRKLEELAGQMASMQKELERSRTELESAAAPDAASRHRRRSHRYRVGLPATRVRR